MSKSIKSTETKVKCPVCNTEFAIPAQSSITVGIAIGKDSNLGTIYPQVAEPSKQQRTAQERLEALRIAGVDVGNLFAMAGNEHICRIENGTVSVIAEDDPIFNYIMESGTVPNNRLFRRWVMAQMFRMMTQKDWKSKQVLGIAESIKRKGYKYTWTMLIDELNAQAHMAKNGDQENYDDRNRWFNTDVAVAMAHHYIDSLKAFLKNTKPVKRCKGVPYITVAGKHVFVSDLDKKVYRPFYVQLSKIKNAKTANQLLEAVKDFYKSLIHLPWYTTQCKEWVDAYKGSGAYFTLQNMIRFHGCHIIDDAGKKLDKTASLAFITAKACLYCKGEGWRMLGVMKKCLQDNNINLQKKMTEWNKKARK